MNSNNYQAPSLCLVHALLLFPSRVGLWPGLSFLFLVDVRRHLLRRRTQYNSSTVVLLTVLSALKGWNDTPARGEIRT